METNPFSIALTLILAYQIFLYCLHVNSTGVSSFITDITSIGLCLHTKSKSYLIRARVI